MSDAFLVTVEELHSNVMFSLASNSEGPLITNEGVTNANVEHSKLVQ